MVDPKVLPRAHRPHRPHQAALVTNSYTVVKHQRGLRGQPWSLRKPELHPKVRPGDGCEETFETTTGSSQDKIWSQFDLKMLILLMFFVGPPSVTQHATMVCFSMVREQWLKVDICVVFFFRFYLLFYYEMRYAWVHAPFEKKYLISPSLTARGSVFGLKKLATKICSPAVQSRQGVPSFASGHGRVPVRFRITGCCIRVRHFKSPQEKK